jgi:hypothetical protein
MSDPEHFLSRWSRKKQQDKRQEERQEKREEKREAAAPPAAPETTRAPNEGEGEGTDRPAAQRDPAGDGVTAFDPASLPPVESIGAQTDIGAFMQPGVPSELRNAALRRAWSVDPAIRDFKGLQENDWNFNDPNGIPGFGPLSPDLDVKKMVGALFGETPKQEPTAPACDAAAEQKPESSNDSIANAPLAGAGMIMPTADGARPAEPADGALPTAPTQTDFVQREKAIASQDKNSESDSTSVKRRRPGGGALPQ